jgi:hypothetical protein
MTDCSEGELFLDASALEPPVPFQQAVSILRQLQSGHYLRMIHRRVPRPLFDNCTQLGISHRYFASDQNNWIILFWRNDDPAIAEYCQRIDS